ncbi:hypothetical protein [Bacillus sp. TL12]|uniref:hypothetical protein n=1 Tax=Bacillus sp. TL12 TaxID=2894756 RepID=UPI001F518E1F|nr:hypothetical protein [Bacillus sp. TL12]MCI0764367.1 hypothetical protein [Bacillus sp. TL12]
MIRQAKKEEIVIVRGWLQEVAISLCDKEKWNASLWNDEIDAYFIHRIVVSKEGKGLNIGSQFIQWAKNRAREPGKKLRLDCVASLLL